MRGNLRARIALRRHRGDPEIDAGALHPGDFPALSARHRPPGGLRLQGPGVRGGDRLVGLVRAHGVTGFIPEADVPLTDVAGCKRRPLSLGC